MKKPLITGLLSLTLAASIFNPTYAAVDSNCGEGEVTCLEVVKKVLTLDEKYAFLQDKEIFKGKADGKAHLDKKMTRAELAVVIDRMLELEVKGKHSFKDLKKHWAKDEIEAVVDAGYMEGSEGKFLPNKHVTLEELASVLVKVTELDTGDYASIWLPGSDWAQGYLAAALTEELLGKADDYTAKATRGDLVQSIYQTYQMLFTNGGIVAGTLEPSLTYVENKNGSFDFTYEVKNQTEKVQTLEFTSGQRFDYDLYKDGKEIYQYSMDKMFILEYAQIELKQGEELTFNDTLKDLKPGNYEIEFWLADKDNAWPDAKTKISFKVK